ncbi:MAG: DUF402 domain-containing protein [Clostridia bacterium]|nr:DUF402 domain-containing protein [Clostridia bacterium]
MRRSDWHRVLEKEYRFCEFSWEGKRGIASTLLIKKVSQPLTIHYEHGDVTIANVGNTWLQLALENSRIWVTAMYNNRNELLQIYFDITNGNRIETSDNPTFEDLYLDVVLEADGTLHVLDRDELDEALEQGQISQEIHRQAVETCDDLYHYLTKRWQEFADFCMRQLLRLQSMND